MSKIHIHAHPRKKVKKVRNLIEEGFLPAVIYDQSGKSTNIKIEHGIAEKLLQELTGTPIVHISIDNTEYVTVLKETQTDLRRNRVHHLSFMALDPKREAVFNVELVLTGEAPAVKNSIGVLISTQDSLELRGLPDKIPAHLAVDVTALANVGDTVSVEDITIPEDLEFVHDEDKELVLATIQPFQKTLEEELEEEKEKAEEAAALEGEEEAEGEETEAEGETAEGDTEEDKDEKPEETEKQDD